MTPRFPLIWCLLCIFDSYLLATCTFTPLYGRLSDVMGRRGAKQSAIIFAAIGILACGVSNSMQMLIVARFVGARFPAVYDALIILPCFLLLSDIWNGRRRNLYHSSVRLRTFPSRTWPNSFFYRRIITSDMYNGRVSFSFLLRSISLK